MTVSTRAAIPVTAVLVAALTACSSAAPSPAATASSPASAAPAPSPTPKLSPYAQGYAHGQDRRADAQFAEKPITPSGDWTKDLQTKSNEQMRVAMVIATHCQEWAAKTVTDYAEQSAYGKGCADGIHDKPPAQTN